MADPKYANLPGIDTSSPDVFETSELPEDDQVAQLEAGEEFNSESIEKVNLDTKTAFTAFKGKNVKGDGVDFSDRIGKTSRTGYDVSQTEYEILAQGMARETPQQKYQRLQHEMRELAEEVSQIKESVKDEKSSEKLSPVAMGKQLEYLQHQLTDLHLEKLLGPEASIDLSDPQGALRQRLLTQLESYKSGSTGSGGGDKKDKAAPSGDHVSYSLYYRPEQAQFSKNARMANLEERLERLQAVIGSNSEKIGVLTADTDNKSLLGAVSILNSKLSLLEQPNLEQVDARLQGVLHKLGQIAEKKETQEDVEKQAKVTELYDIVKKWEAYGNSLPQVIDRLAALKDLHEQALQFSQALAYLDTAQQEITSSLNSHGDMLKTLQDSFKQNTDMIKSNTESLETRVKALTKS